MYHRSRRRRKDHYNKLKNYDVSRNQDPCLPVRQFNNWAKRMLIDDLARHGRDMVVHDWCGGKGGDIHKWSKYNVADYTLVDLAEGSVRDAKERFNTTKYKFSRHFVVLDLSLNNQWPYHSRVDLISLQFGLHYFQGSYELSNVFRNAYDLLKPGGYIFGICANGDAILKQAWEKGKRVNTPAYDPMYQHKIQYTPDNADYHQTRHFSISWGNELFRISNLTEYGYQFTLGNRVKNVYEHVLKEDVLRRAAATCGFEVHHTLDLKEYYERSIHGRKAWLLYQEFMTCSPMTTAAWEVIDLYRVFVLRKPLDTPSIPTDDQKDRSPDAGGQPTWVTTCMELDEPDQDNTLNK